MLAANVEERTAEVTFVQLMSTRKVDCSMAIATMKLITTESFRALGRKVGPDGVFARSHTAPKFRRLHS